MAQGGQVVIRCGDHAVCSSVILSKGGTDDRKDPEKSRGSEFHTSRGLNAIAFRTSGFTQRSGWHKAGPHCGHEYLAGVESGAKRGDPQSSDRISRTRRSAASAPADGPI